MRVMIVEHDRWLREMYAHIFRGFGVGVSVSDSAQDCLTQLDEQPADVMLLNLSLPLHNGVEVLHELQSYQDWQNIPIIAMSNRQKATYCTDDAVWRAHGVRHFAYLPETPPRALLDIARHFMT